MESKSGYLNKQDIRKWLKNTLIFSTPAILAFLTAIQNGQNMDFAIGAGYSALAGSTIDLLKKWSEGE